MKSCEGGLRRLVAIASWKQGSNFMFTAENPFINPLYFASGLPRVSRFSIDFYSKILRPSIAAGKQHYDS